MDIAVVVNLSARKGSHAFAALAKDKLPSARVIATTSLADLERFVDETASRRTPPALVLSGGGDGTAIALLDALRARDVAFPPFGLVPLGTGNGWAISTKAPRPRAAIDQVAQMVQRGLAAPPTSDYGLVEVEGRLTPFAGTGWDAELLHDYKLQRAAFPTHTTSSSRIAAWSSTARCPSRWAATSSACARRSSTGSTTGWCPSSTGRAWRRGRALRVLAGWSPTHVSARHTPAPCPAARAADTAACYDAAPWPSAARARESACWKRCFMPTRA